MSENIKSIEFVAGIDAAAPVTVNLEGAPIGTLEVDPTDAMWKFNPATTAPLSILVLEAIVDQLAAR